MYTTLQIREFHLWAHMDWYCKIMTTSPLRLEIPCHYPRLITKATNIAPFNLRIYHLSTEDKIPLKYTQKFES